MQRSNPPNHDGFPIGDDMVVLRYPVAHQYAGIRLDRFVQIKIPRLSRTRAQAIVRACARHPDGRSRKPSDAVVAGEVVTLVRPMLHEPQDIPLDFGVVFEDDALLVLDKPAGLPVHPSATYHRRTLVYVLRARYGDNAPQIAHRIDRETSGVMVCGRTLDDERALKLAFERRSSQKMYLAIVRGAPPQDAGTITMPLARVTSGLHLKMDVRDEGPASWAETRYEVRARARDASLVALWPKSGRQHQLRVHLSATGCSIIGDKLYGPEQEEPFLEYNETGMTEALVERLGHPRHALHAYELTVKHPRSGDDVTFRAPLPVDLAELWLRHGGLADDLKPYCNPASSHEIQEVR